MGGCATKFKDADDDLRPELLQNEAPVSSEKNAEAAVVVAVPEAEADVKGAEAVAEEKHNGGEKQNEAPLVDLSETKQDGAADASSDVHVQTRDVVVEPASAAALETHTEAKLETPAPAAAPAASASASQPTEEKIAAPADTPAPAAAATTDAPAAKEEVKEKEIEAKVEVKNDAPLVAV